MIEFSKALRDADAILAGQPADVRADDLESALLKLADSRRQGNETGAQAFARLAAANDSDVMRIWAACDQQRVNETHAPMLKRDPRALTILQRCEAEVEALVDMQKRDDETREAAHSRLARDSREYARAYSLATDARRLVAG